MEISNSDIINQLEVLFRPYSIREVIDVIPEYVFEDVLHCIADATTGEIQSTAQNAIINGLKQLFANLQVYTEACSTIGMIDPLIEARIMLAEFDFKKAYELDKEMPEELSQLTPELNILLASNYKEKLYDKFELDSEAREIYDQQILNLASGLPSNKSLFTFEFSKELAIHLRAAMIEAERSVGLQLPIIQDSRITSIASIIALGDKHQKDIDNWIFYWKDNIPEIFSLSKSIAILENVNQIISGVANGISEEEAQTHIDLLIFVFLLLWYVYHNWQEELFEKELPETFDNPFLRGQLALFLNEHPQGMLFKQFYNDYCIRRDIRPIINTDVLYAADLEDSHKNQKWFLPIVDVENNKQFVTICSKVDQLYDCLAEEGYLEQSENNHPAQKLLFRYRFTGCLPAYSLNDKIDWNISSRGAKTDLAVFLKALSDMFYIKGTERAPYSILNKYFNISLTNVAQLANSADKAKYDKFKKCIEQIFK